MLTQLTTFATIGLVSPRITVEVAGVRGKGKMTIVGLGDTAVKESEQRVRHALRSCGYRITTGQSITVNLAPADIRKIGPRYDLAIALGVLSVNGSAVIPEEAFRATAFLGELALDGSLRHVSGVLSSAIACREQGIPTIVVPEEDGPEAALIPGLRVIGARHLSDVVSILTGEKEAQPVPDQNGEKTYPVAENCPIDFADVRGQEHAKRALEIAAAGGHNVLLSGAPGAGKTLLAKAFRGILPPLSREESIEVTRIYSVANLLPCGSPLLTRRPFRAVHHTASGVSIVGGGQVPRPGEISLAHRGVLFLDELAEFPANVLEVLRQPMEDRTITITRAQGAVTFPADFIMIAAMNPPEFCANPGRARGRVSQPLLDRIDLQIAVDPVPVEDLQKGPAEGAEQSGAIFARVSAARARQAARFAELPMRTNAEMSVKQIDTLCPLDTPSKALLRQAVDRLRLSARAYHRTIKVARTIADLAGDAAIGASHVAEAL